MQLNYTVTEKDNGRRAVDVLCSRTGMSRVTGKKIRLYGSLMKNGQHWRMIDPVETGDILVAEYWPEGNKPAPLRMDPLLPVVYQDEWLIIVNKPTGMVTHPTYLHDKGSVTDRLADHPLHPVIRLDRDTTGLLLVAMNGHAHHVISSAGMDKSYIALVHGKLPTRDGMIDLPIGRDPDSIMLRRIDKNGLPAKTSWHVCRYFSASNISLVKFKLITGRTHQIRLHSKSIGHPLLGDWLYGLEKSEVNYHKDDNPFEDNVVFEADKLLSRQALHAATLSFTHPKTLKRNTVTASLPEDFRQALRTIYDYEKTRNAL